MYERIPGFVRFYQNYFPAFKAAYAEPVIEVEFSDRAINKLDLGCGYIAVIDNDNKLYMWGDNYAGQLGQKDDIHRDHPVIVKDLTNTDIVDVSCGFQHCLVLDSNGVVYGMGK